jgi:glycosyltransferase involved in cell wall biosynthesis
MTLAAARPGPLRRALELDRLDAAHFPLSVMLPPVDAPPATTTIHDLLHEEYPGFFSRAERAYRRVVYGWSVRRSRIVTTVSEHARESIVARYRLDPDRVRAIHSGIDHERFTPAPRERQQFLLYPANAWPHKNHERLLAAFRLVRRERPDLRLVLTGTGHERRGGNGVEARGLVPRDELVELYRTAAALVFPSLYEGFGQPPLEAMACGCPVAVSRVASLPEVCGDAAVYFDPAAVESIAAGIHEVLDRPRAGGVERARRFTWEHAARDYDAVYRELAAR